MKKVGIVRISKPVSKKEKGITLIALVITIIVLLILTGVALASLTNENGLIARAKEVKEIQNKADFDEKIELINGEATMIKAEKGGFTAQDYFELLKKYKLISDTAVGGNNVKNKGTDEFEDTIYTVTTDTDYVFDVVIDKNGDINFDYKGIEGQIVIPITNITLQNASITVEEYNTFKLDMLVEPENATHKSIIWNSSDDSVATAKDDVILAGTPGKATLTGKTTDGSNKTLTCTVTVQAGMWVTLNDGTNIKVGDFVNYNHKTGEICKSYSSRNGYGEQTFRVDDYNYGWRVFGVDNSGQLLLISEDFVPLTGGKTDSTTGRSYFYLGGGINVFNNYCIGEINSICNYYGQGEGATGGRGINIEDLNNITGYINPSRPANGRVSKYKKGTIDEYGNTVTYTSTRIDRLNYTGTNGVTSYATYGPGSKYPFSVYNETKKKWEELGVNDGSSITVKQEYYSYYPNTLKETKTGYEYGISTNSTAYKMLFTNSSTGANPEKAGTTDDFAYWLSSKCIGAGYSVGYFVRTVYNGRVTGSELAGSGFGHSYTSFKGVRPLVSLKSDIKLERTSETRDNCPVWNIVIE